MTKDTVFVAEEEFFRAAKAPVGPHGNAGDFIEGTMSYLLENRVTERAANGPQFSIWQGPHALAGDVEKDLAVLRFTLPRLCQALLDDPHSYSRVLKMPVHVMGVSLLPSLQAMERLWVASRVGAAALPVSPASRVARRFTSRLLDVCDQALEWSHLALKHGHFEDGNQNILSDLEALTHILRVTSTLALWHIRWGLLNGSHSSTRSAGTLRLLTELLASCPGESAFRPHLDETRHQLMLSCLLCLARLEKRSADEIHRAWGLLEGIPRHVLLQCFCAGSGPQGPCIVFAFNDLCLTDVGPGDPAPRQGIGVAPIQQHFRDHVPRDWGDDFGCLAPLLHPDEDRGPHHTGREAPALRSVQVSLGVGNIVRGQREWLEFLAPRGAGAEDENVKVLESSFGSLRASQRLLLQQCSGNVVSVRSSPEDAMSLCLITSVEFEAGRSRRLHLQLLSTNWFVDSVQPLDLAWEKAEPFNGSAILARGTHGNREELLMIVELDLRQPRPSVLPSRIRLRSSGVDYERVGPPRHLWGAICMKIVPSNPEGMAPSLAVSNSYH